MMIYDVLGIFASMCLLALSPIEGRVAFLLSLHHMTKMHWEETFLRSHRVPLSMSVPSAGLSYPKYLSTVPP